MSLFRQSENEFEFCTLVFLFVCEGLPSPLMSPESKSVRIEMAVFNVVFKNIVMSKITRESGKWWEAQH